MFLAFNLSYTQRCCVDPSRYITLVHDAEYFVYVLYMLLLPFEIHILLDLTVLTIVLHTSTILTLKQDLTFAWD